MKSKKKNIQLKNWSYGTHAHVDSFTPPELIPICLAGKVYNHPNPRHTDGKQIVTSAVMGQRKGLVVTRSGNEYELLEPAADYEKMFPNAKARLFKSLPKL